VWDPHDQVYAAGGTVAFAVSEKGTNVPAEWYFWRDEADDVYQAELRAWQDAQGRGDDSPILLRDVRRVVFLEHSMPPELAGLDASQLLADGVIRIPGSAACEYIVEDFETQHDVTLTKEEAAAVIRAHLSQ
jgi:hypothetical protein